MEKLKITLSIFLIGFIFQDNFCQEPGAYVRENFSDLKDRQIIDTLLNLSAGFSEDNRDTALFFARNAYVMSERLNDRERLKHSAYRIAEAFTNHAGYKEAIGYYRIAAEIEFDQKKDSTPYFAERLSDMGFCYQELGIIEKSLELFMAALCIQEKAGNLEEMGNNLSNIGTNYYYQAKYDKSLEYYDRALQIDRKRNDSEAIAISLNNIAMMYSRWGKFEQALVMYEEALLYTVSEAKKSIRFSNIGMTWLHLGDYDKALEYLNKALRIDQKFNHKIRIAIRKSEIGTILAAKGEFRKAAALQREALNVFHELEIAESEIITLSDLGDTYVQLRQNDSARICFEESAKIADATGSLHHRIRNYQALCRLAEQEGDFKDALAYFRLSSTLSDSIYNREKHDQLARYEILFETEKIEKEKQILIKDIQIKQKNQRLSYATISGLVLISLMLLYAIRTKSKSLKQNRRLLQREQELLVMEQGKNEAEKKVMEDRIFAEQQINRLQREKFEAELEHKNRELANATICLVNKNEILREIMDKIRSGPGGELLSDVVKYINTNTDIDLNWNKFRIEFEKVHPGFFDKVRHTFPQLTEHDIRLSAYLRINLSSREIAGLMNVTLEAVNKHRQRLRKKLEMEQESDIAAFFRGL